MYETSQFHENYWAATLVCTSLVLLLQRRDADICSLIGAMRTVLLLAAVSAADAFAPAAFHLASAPVARNFCKPPASAGLRMAKDAKEGLFSPVGCW